MTPPTDTPPSSHMRTAFEQPSLAHPITGIQLGPAIEARQRRSVEREARRRRRREARERKKVVDHEDGMSSDDELLEANKMKFSAELGQECK